MTKASPAKAECLPEADSRLDCPPAARHSRVFAVKYFSRLLSSTVPRKQEDSWEADRFWLVGPDDRETSSITIT